jgi:hypothetical protein
MVATQEVQLSEAFIPLMRDRDASPVCLSPWLENPYRLVSLLELMKSFVASDLLRSARNLQNRATLIFEKDSGLSQPARIATLNGFRDSLRTFMELCDNLGLQMSSLHASQLLATADDASARTMLYSEHAERMANMFSVTVENEVSLRLYFEIPPEKAKFYGDGADPFGVAVGTAFPSVSFDAGEAGKCYALGRNTACVFHLMRVL